jgi:hypothetical protein
MNQVVTRVVADLHSLTGEVDVLAAEVGALLTELGQERFAEGVPAPRSAPDDGSSR